MPLSDEDMYKMFGPTSCAPDEIQEIKTQMYFIVAYCTPDNSRRCFGYYTSLSKARAALHNQWKDMEECYYDSFLIEEVKEGLFVIGKIIEYYEIDDRILISKEMPHMLKGLVNWSIG